MYFKKNNAIDFPPIFLINLPKKRSKLKILLNRI